MTKVLVIGDGIIDHYLFCNSERMSPEDSSVPVLDQQREEYRLGGCFNVTANIKSLNPDLQVEVLSVFSPQTGGRLFNSNIKTFHNNTPIHYQHKSELEIIKTRVYGNNNKQIVRIDNVKKLDNKDVEHYHKKFLESNIDHYDAIIVSDYEKGFVNENIIKKLETYNGLVFVDTKKSDLSLWANIKNCIVKVNGLEYEKSIGAMCLKNLIVTQGQFGAIWYNTPLLTRGRITKEFPTTPIENPDVTGCGDVFLAGLVVEFLKTKDFTKAIHFANMVAGESAKQFGTTIVRLNK